MIEFDIEINHPVGLYASLADGLVTLANRYDAAVTLSYQDKEVSMKSLMGVISLGVPCQGVVHLKIEGREAKEMKQSIDLFLKDRMSFFS
jgi:phosphocarrier protein